jgi:hypothetical protein
MSALHSPESMDNNVLKKRWKGAVVAKFKVLYQHFPRGTEENHINVSQNSLCPSTDSNLAFPKQKPEAVLLKLAYVVT